jgi:hypothetical protein
MFLLFPCLGTILVASCPVSCQPSFSPAPSSGSIVAASSHLYSRSSTTPTLFCAAGPAPSPSKLGPGMRSSLSAVSRPARLRTPSLAGRGRPQGLHPSGPAATKQVSFSDLLVSSPSSLCRHEMVPERFSYPARRFLHARDRRRLHSLHRRGTRPVDGHRHRG